MRMLVTELRAVTPPELQYLITDMFETITLYDNRTVIRGDAGSQVQDDAAYGVEEVQSGWEGNERSVPLKDLIELGVFKGKKGEEVPLHVEKQGISQPASTIQFVVDERPTRAGIDPYNKLIDRNPEDNTVDVMEE